MNLFKTSIFNGMAVGVKILTLLGVNKVLAIYVGPAGYAALGQFQNAIQILTTFASGAINTGVTKYTAEYNKDEVSQHILWKTAGSICLIGSFFMSIIIAIFNKQLTLYFFNDYSYRGVFLWFACTLTFFTLNVLLLSILNGKKEVKLYVLSNILGSIFSFVVIAISSIKFGAYGALVGLTIYQSISFFITLMLCLKTSWFKVEHLIGKIEREILVKLGKYTLMALTSAACVPTVQILIRKHVNITYGVEFAGNWEALQRISGAYLMFVTSTLSIYLLPKLSELKKRQEIRNELFQSYKFILPATILMSLLMFFSKDIIIKILFTSDFIKIKELMGWQFVGDTLKITSWVLGYVMLGQSLMGLFIFTEVLGSLMYWLLVLILSQKLGFVGVTVAYAANYLLYLLILIYCLQKKKII